MKPSVSVVVLSYNRPRHLERALASVAQQTDAPSEVLVVDNRSPASGEIASVVARYPGFTLIANPLNTGFTGGMNAGIHRAQADCIYLSEDDIVLAPDCIAELATYGTRHPDALLTGIMTDAETGTILSAGGRVVLGRTYRQIVRGRGEPDRGQFTEPADVEYIPGSMVFARRDVFRRLGGFREDFFVYGEDVELCLRARRAGFRITVVPKARVQHLPSPGPASDLVEYHKLKNLLALHLLHAPGYTLPEFFARYVVLGLARHQPRALRRLLLRAVGWNARHLFSLLRDRRRLPSAAAETA